MTTIGLIFGALGTFLLGALTRPKIDKFVTGLKIGYQEYKLGVLRGRYH